ncbi:MAG: class I SAM-dependent methyltransferase [Bacteroidota bacterium]
MSKNLFQGYKPKFFNDKNDEFQQILNQTYDYIDLPTLHLHRLRINLFVEILKKLELNKVIKSYEKALDIGCNCGIYSKLLSDFGFKNVLGIDIDRPLLEIAKKKNSVSEPSKSLDFQYQNAEELNDNEKVDFILCTEVIEHTQNPDKVITHIHNKLNKGGVAVITLPNANSYPYFLTKWSYILRGKKIQGELYDHLQFPSSRSKKLFDFPDTKLIHTTGTNLFYWYFLHKIPGFKYLNKLNYTLGKISFLKNFNQFYFIVIQKN